MENSKNEPKYHTAKNWQIGLFALNNTATNMYMIAIGLISYYATGIAGLALVVVSVILTAMRIFDGITDPIIGFIIDKTDSKFGKFRPFMILGNIILAIMVLVIYNTTHLVPGSWRLIYFIAMYGIYVIGYTFQTACTKAAQTALTNHPKQRPTFTLFDSIYNALLFMGMGFIQTNILLPKYDLQFSQGFFTEFNAIVIIGSAIMTILAVIGIWGKDKKEYYGAGDAAEQLKFRDYWPVLKNNRAIQMLVIAASTDKLASSSARNAVVPIMLFGIIMGNVQLSGQLGAITMIPNLILIFVGVGYARKFGQKKAFVVSTWISIIIASLLCALLIFGDPRTISFETINFMTIAFVVLYVAMGAIGAICGNIVIPMIADCSDYETSISGRFVPGMMGTLFSFVDKLISSLSSTIVGFMLAAIGFTNTMPVASTPLTPEIFTVTLLLFFGLPIMGWIASLIAMKFYPLDGKKMEEVQIKVAEIKAVANK